jgi:hypothetical protein
MTPTTTPDTLRVGDWVALVGDDIVASGRTEEEAIERAWDRGFRDITLARVAEPGTHVI